MITRETITQEIKAKIKHYNEQITLENARLGILINTRGIAQEAVAMGMVADLNFDIDLCIHTISTHKAWVARLTSRLEG